MGLFYCKKCGRIIDTYEDIEEEQCDYCNSIMPPIPEKYLYEGFTILQESEQLLIEELVKTSPEFDQNLYDHLDEFIAGQNAKYEEMKAFVNNMAEKKKNVPKCPTCSSTNIKRVSTTSKVVNTAIFGMFGTKRFRQWHCNNCGSEW